MFVSRFALTVFVASSFTLLACTGERAAVNDASTRRIVDDFGDSVDVAPAMRIASLSPTTTELLFSIGAGGRVVGRTSYDEWPTDAKRVPDLGPGIRPNVEAILAAHPDLVVLYAANDNRDAARALRAAGVRTIGLKVDRIADFRRATALLGAVAGDSAGAQAVIDSVQRTLDRVRTATAQLRHPRIVWQLWDTPLLVLGSGSYQHELVEIAGAENVYGDDAKPNTQTSLEDLIRRDPDVILTDSSRASAIRRSARWRGVRAVREEHVLAVDDETSSRASVKLGMAAVALARLLHPEANIR
jgi:ABC-type Fe3+-hydroxamate transport system substrate-binding protein